jgi:hypothetical protein
VAGGQSFEPEATFSVASAGIGASFRVTLLLETRDISQGIAVIEIAVWDRISRFPEERRT